MEEFEQIYEQHATAVYRVSLQVTGQKELAAEITSQAFGALYQNWNTIDRKQLPDWLFSIAKHRATVHWRHEIREGRWTANDDSNQQWREPARSFTSLLRQCPDLEPLHRICILLRFVHSFSITEIAQRTNMNERQVKGHSQYALHLLRERIMPGNNPGHKPGHRQRQSTEGVPADA